MKYDYPPLEISYKDFCRLRGLTPLDKRVPWTMILLFKWDIHVKKDPSDEIGFCFQYRGYRRLWFYILTWLPVTVYRLFLAIWQGGLLNLRPYRRLKWTIEIKNGDNNKDLDEIARHEFVLVDYYWREHAKPYVKETSSGFHGF